MKTDNKKTMILASLCLGLFLKVPFLFIDLITYLNSKRHDRALDRVLEAKRFSLELFHPNFDTSQEMVNSFVLAPVIENLFLVPFILMVRTIKEGSLTSSIFSTISVIVISSMAYFDHGGGHDAIVGTSLFFVMSIFIFANLRKYKMFFLYVCSVITHLVFNLSSFFFSMFF